MPDFGIILTECVYFQNSDDIGTSWSCKKFTERFSSQRRHTCQSNTLGLIAEPVEAMN